MKPEDYTYYMANTFIWRVDNETDDLWVYFSSVGSWILQTAKFKESGIKKGKLKELSEEDLLLEFL